MGELRESDEPAVEKNKQCKCCITEHHDEKTEEPIGSPVAHLPDHTVEQVDCFAGCAACCREFDHQHCTNADTCRHHSTESASLLNHQHEGLRKRSVWRTRSAVQTQIDVAEQTSRSDEQTVTAFKKLTVIDRFLSVWILLVMVIGVLVGYYSSDASSKLQDVELGETQVSLPVSFGLWFMMWPVLVKVKYESFGAILRRKDMLVQLGFSLLANWLIGPFIMLAVAWACLPDLDHYRNGVIMVGLARCIAMVLIWNELARGDPEYCAILVAVNSVLQIVLYAPLALFFLVVISDQYTGEGEEFSLHYWDVFQSVLVFLGVPLVAAVLTRYLVIKCAGWDWFNNRFVPFISPLALIALLWTVFVIFVIQGHNIIDNIGDVCRVAVPMVLYFVLMFCSSLMLCRWFKFGYERAVTQAFTASSNNFELAIAVAAGTFGAGSREALAATIGPLVEVPVLLGLVYVALWLKPKLSWSTREVCAEPHADASELQLGRCP